MCSLSKNPQLSIFFNVVYTINSEFIKHLLSAAFMDYYIRISGNYRVQ